MAQNPFFSKTDYSSEHPTALAIYCSDGRFTRPVEELLAELGHSRLDTLTIPGGPALLNHLTAGYLEADHIGRSAEFLIRAHHLREVVLIAHDGCGFYARKYSDLTQDQIKKRQIDDLKVAMKTLKANHPQLHLDAFVATPSTPSVKFEKVLP